MKQYSNDLYKCAQCGKYFTKNSINSHGCDSPIQVSVPSMEQRNIGTVELSSAVGSTEQPSSGTVEQPVKQRKRK